MLVGEYVTERYHLGREGGLPPFVDVRAIKYPPTEWDRSASSARKGRNSAHRSCCVPMARLGHDKLGAMHVFSFSQT